MICELRAGWRRYRCYVACLFEQLEAENANLGIYRLAFKPPLDAHVDCNHFGRVIISDPEYALGLCTCAKEGRQRMLPDALRLYGKI